MKGEHGDPQSGPDRPESQPARVGHDELRHADRRRRQPGRAGHRPRRRYQFRRYRRCVRRAAVAGHGAGLTASPRSIIGRWLATRSTDVGTRSCWPPRCTNRWAPDRTTGPLGVPHPPACEDSLRRLQTDHIDLYQMHHVDRSTPWEEIWQAMEQLVAAGKVIYVGSSNFAGWQIAAAQGAATARHFMGLVAEQSRYNLNARTIELEVIPACGTSVWGSSRKPVGRRAAGRRAQKSQRRAAAPANGCSSRSNSTAQLEAYEQLCRELGEQPADVALAWLLHQPAVTAAIVGPAHRRPADRQPARPRGHVDRGELRNSTRSGPARAARHRRRTPGDSARPFRQP